MLNIFGSRASEKDIKIFLPGQIVLCLPKPLNNRDAKFRIERLQLLPHKRIGKNRRAILQTLPLDTSEAIFLFIAEPGSRARLDWHTRYALSRGQGAIWLEKRHQHHLPFQTGQRDQFQVFDSVVRDESRIDEIKFILVSRHRGRREWFSQNWRERPGQLGLAGTTFLDRLELLLRAVC